MAECSCHSDENSQLERKTLWILLLINATMFVAEGVTGWFAESTGLLADSLDMLADASVYGISLYAVAGSKRLQARAASVSGVLQVILGLGVLLEVIRRFIYGSDPVSGLMMGMGTVALIANVACLALISKHREGGMHMRASWIFSTNDVIANVGLIASGALVYLLSNRIPDLVIGCIVSALVVRGGLQILRESKASTQCA